jgi:excisionase family DNA binding protein
MRERRQAIGQRFVTVEEAAELLRVAVNTIYRWCRAGRLPARKFGREWRIDSSALEEVGCRAVMERANLLEPIVRRLYRGGECLLGLAVDRATEQRLQALFLDLALREPSSAARLVLWDETPEEATARLRPILAPHGEKKRILRFLRLGERYSASGLAGVLEELQVAAAHAKESGERVWLTASPQRFFGANVERLVEYECAVHELALRELGRGASGLSMCTYDFSYADAPVLKMVSDLVECHSAVTWFDGSRVPHLLRLVM